VSVQLQILGHADATPTSKNTTTIAVQLLWRLGPFYCFSICLCCSESWLFSILAVFNLCLGNEHARKKNSAWNMNNLIKIRSTHLLWFFLVNLVVFYYLSASEIWQPFMGGALKDGNYCNSKET
jgi:hypothetical protein